MAPQWIDRGKVLRARGGRSSSNERYGHEEGRMVATGAAGARRKGDDRNLRSTRKVGDGEWEATATSASPPLFKALETWGVGSVTPTSPHFHTMAARINHARKPTGGPWPKKIPRTGRDLPGQARGDVPLRW